MEKVDVIEENEISEPKRESLLIHLLRFMLHHKMFIFTFIWWVVAVGTSVNGDGTIGTSIQTSLLSPIFGEQIASLLVLFITFVCILYAPVEIILFLVKKIWYYSQLIYHKCLLPFMVKVKTSVK